tara:strand:- start:189 stop:974 length:786 start_codon:yes stop_codon:yes gene_type:complete
MIILKDKKDIKFAPEGFLKDCEWESHGQYDSLDFVNPDVKIISVQFTKVGEKTYRAFPNLEWIIIRQHGFDNVNIEDCEKRGIGVITTKPFAQSTANWINQFIDEKEVVGLIGYGSIGSKVKANNIHSFFRNNRFDKLNEIETLIVSCPPEKNKHLINKDILSNFKGKLISVSRSEVIDNEALLKYIDNITEAHIDTLDSKYRKELLDTGKVHYYGHTAWQYNFSYENNIEYFNNLEETIKQCRTGFVKNPVLARSERVTF